MKYTVRDSEKLNELIGRTGNTINSFSNAMHASSSYLKLVVNGKKSVFPPYAMRIVNLLNKNLILKKGEERPTIDTIFFDASVGKR